LEQYRSGCLQRFQTLVKTTGAKALFPESGALYWRLGLEYRKQQYLAGARWSDYALRILKELE
jgi:hypothetical protein